MDNHQQQNNLSEDLISLIKQKEIQSSNLNQSFDDKATFGQMLSDKMASFGGSWSFILSFASILIVWILFNIFVGKEERFDPYPFILLNLMLSCLAAIQAPIIMMSQNRQETKDRMRNENDYMVNLKAELEIRELHAKIDEKLIQQLENLLQIQQQQMSLMNENIRLMKESSSSSK